VNRIAIKYMDHMDIDDLIGYGIFGLIDAVEKFDLDRGIKFETYASFRIRGEIIDRIRQQDWIPRSLRAKVRQVERALEELEMKQGRNVPDEELADYMGISLDELNTLMGQMHTSAILSLDSHILDIVGMPSELVGSEGIPEEHAVTNELKEILGQAIGQLTEREQKIVDLYYYHELTLKEIGMVIGVSESRVSQLLSRALLKLKNKLKGAGLYLKEEDHG
jgi:RNA polymerase sigma factor for flagellar operon FliA